VVESVWEPLVPVMVTVNGPPSPEELEALLAAQQKDDAAEAAAKAADAKDKAAAAADAAAAAAAAHNDTAEAAADQQAIIDAAIAAGNTIVQLPEDFSEAHRKLIRHGRKETRQSIQAARRVAVVLTDKDETIRSLVANITWMTVNMGKLADKVICSPSTSLCSVRSSTSPRR